MKYFFLLLPCFLFFAESCRQAQPQKSAEGEALAPDCAFADSLFANAKVLAEKDDSTAINNYLEAAAAYKAADCPPSKWFDAIKGATVHARKKKNYDLALQIGTQALRAIWWKPEDKNTGKIYLDIGYSHNQNGEYVDALPYYQAALEIYRRGEKVAENINEALLKPLANIYTRLGDSEKAIALLKEAKGLSEQQKDTIYICRATADLAAAYMTAGDIENANATCDYGLKLLERARPADEKQKKSLSNAKNSLTVNKATVLFSINREEDAKKILSKANIEKPEFEADAYTTVGDYNLQNHRYAEAKTNFQRAYAIRSKASKSKLNRELAKIEVSIAEACRGAGQLDSAQFYCQQAFRHVIPNFKSKSFADNPLPRDFFPENTIGQILSLKTELLWDAYKNSHVRAALLNAQSTAGLALAVADTLFRTYDYESSQLSALENARTLRHRYLDILYERRTTLGEGNLHAEIFEFVEQSKGVLMRQKMAAARIMGDSSAVGAQSAQERKLQANLTQLKNQFHAAETGGVPKTELDSLRQEIFAVETERNKVLRTMERDNPAFYHARYSPATTSLRTVREQLLPADGMLVEYFHDPEHRALYIIAITKSGFYFEKDTLSRERVEQFTGLFNDSKNMDKGGDPAIWQAFVTQSAGLYHSLLAKVMPASGIEHLAVVPDGVLCNLPFEILLTQKPSTQKVGDYQQLPYLLNNVNVRYGPSATYLAEAGRKRSSGFAMNYFGIAPRYSDTLDVTHNEDCVQALNARFRGRALTACSATKDVLRDGQIRCKIFHFYGHALADTEKPQFSLMACSSGKNNCADKKHNRAYASLGSKTVPREFTDYGVFAHEIEHWPMEAELAMLTGCETGKGAVSGSEGPLSLARSFQLAGCPATALTLWEADDQAAARLTTLFLENIEAGMPKDAALAQAKRQYLAEPNSASFPFYWAGMVLSGSSEPVNISSMNNLINVGGHEMLLGSALLGLGLMALSFFLLKKIFFG